MAYCPECGAANTTSDTYCGSCGGSLAMPKTPAQIPKPGGSIPPLKNRRPLSISLNKRLAGWLAAFAVVIAGIPLTYHYLLTETRIETTYESVPFEIARTEDEMLLAGIEYTRSPGMNGSKQVKTKVWVKDGAATNRKVVSERVVQPPSDEVVVAGVRTMPEAIEDTKATTTDYFETWKSGDHAAMLSKCSEESLSGFTHERVTAAYQVTGETLESYTLGIPDVMSMDDLIERQKSTDWSYSYTNDSEASLAPEDFPSGSLVVAEVPVTYTTNSAVQGRNTHYENIRLAFIDDSWKIVYFGPVAATAVNQSQRVVNKGYSNDEIIDVAVDFVVVYPDHTLITVHETNATVSRYGSSSLSSYFDSLPSSSSYSSDSFLTDDSVSSLSYVINSDKSTDFEYSVKEGATQSGFLYVEPGIPAEATSFSLFFSGGYSSADDVSFYGIPLP